MSVLVDSLLLWCKAHVVFRIMGANYFLSTLDKFEITFGFPRADNVGGIVWFPTDGTLGRARARILRRGDGRIAVHEKARYFSSIRSFPRCARGRGRFDGILLRRGSIPIDRRIQKIIVEATAFSFPRRSLGRIFEKRLVKRVVQALELFPSYSRTERYLGNRRGGERAKRAKMRQQGGLRATCR